MVVVQRPPGGAVEIIELPVPERPEKAEQAEAAEQKGGGDQVDERGHGVLPRVQRPRCTRSALPVTASDDADITTAAISGVTRPAMASGTAIRL